MNIKTKKWIASLGTIAAIATPGVTVIACGKKASDSAPTIPPVDGVVSDELQNAYDLIEGKSLLTDISSRDEYKYNHKDVITRLYNYKTYYEDNYEIGDLINSPAGEYSTWSDQIDTDSTIILGSAGGPSKGTNPTYFDIKFDTEIGRDVDGNPIGINGGNTTDGGFTTSIDFDGSHFYVAPEWNDGTNGSDLHLINPKQAQSLHYDDEEVVARYKEELLTEEGWNAEYAFDTNLRTVAILEVVSNYFDAKDPLKLNLLTHSFGSMMAPLWMGTFGWIGYQEANEHKFDDIAISAGRLEMPERVVEMAARGSLSSFAKPVENPDGTWTQDFNWHDIDLTTDQDMIDSIQDVLDEEDNEEGYENDPVWRPGDTLDSIFNKIRANFLMQGAYGTLNYMDMMDEYSGAYDNVTYIHGGQDTATGILSVDEVASINKHFKTNMFGVDDGHSTDFAFDVTQPGSAWRILGVDHLRKIT